MQTSDNGWPGIADRADLVTSTVRGTRELRFLLAPGASWILTEFAARFNREVEPLDGAQLDDWSYAWRPVRGTTSLLSCHASGTAIDLNATRHPRGSRGTYTAKDRAALLRLLDEFSDPATGKQVILWGGQFSSASIPDEMHFQVEANDKALKRCRIMLEGEMVTDSDIKDIAHAVWTWDGIPNESAVVGSANPDWTPKTMLSDIENTQDQNTKDIALIKEQMSEVLTLLKAK